MALDDFVDTGDSDNDSSHTDSGGDDSTTKVDLNPDYQYYGPKDEEIVSKEEFEEAVENLDQELDLEKPIPGSLNYGMESPEGNFILYVQYPSTGMDCFLVSVADSSSLYDVVMPEKVWLVEGWQDQLQQAVDDTLDRKSEIEKCDKCGELMIFRTTNNSDELMKGCSDYPNCKNRSQLTEGDL